MSALAIGVITAGFALGHLVRDGVPPLGSTHGARALGAALCGLSTVWFVAPVVSLLVSIAVWIGFYTDSRHAAGQGAGSWSDALNLLVSGVTSTGLLIAVLIGATWPAPPWWLLALPLVKPPIWFLAWRVFPAKMQFPAWLGGERYPLTPAAAIFGGVIGLAVAITAPSW